MNKPTIEPSEKGKIIQKHLEDVGMDAWYYIYQNFVNPPNKNQEKEK